MSEHKLSCRDGGRDALGVAEHALGRLTDTNWRGVAREILSVECATDEELSKLAHMVSFFYKLSLCCCLWS